MQRCGRLGLQARVLSDEFLDLQILLRELAATELPLRLRHRLGLLERKPRATDREERSRVSALTNSIVSTQ